MTVEILHHLTYLHYVPLFLILLTINIHINLLGEFSARYALRSLSWRLLFGGNNAGRFSVWIESNDADMEEWHFLSSQATLLIRRIGWAQNCGRTETLLTIDGARNPRKFHLLASIYSIGRH